MMIRHDDPDAGDARVGGDVMRTVGKGRVD